MVRRNPVKPTMTDVARAANVSQSAVSLVLNDAPGSRISEATRQKVIRAAHKLGYELPPPRIRRANTDAVPKTKIAFVVDEISVSPHSIHHVDGARDAAWSYDCTLAVHVTRASTQIEAATLDAIAADPSIAGVVFASSFTRPVDPPALENVPVVLLNCHTQADLPRVLPDDAADAAQATQHLLSQGHRRIAMIRGEKWMDVAQARLAGYREALREANVPYDPALVKVGNWSVESGYRRTIPLLALDDPPTAIYCASDMMAIGCMDAIHDFGRAVPADISLVGHNDIPITSYTHPALTSVRPANYEMGQRAVELLMGGEDAPLETRIPGELVQRESVAQFAPKPPS
ncbi:MAG: LacI family DNA-binding transcriptional regulator [Propionibacteriaceae bacterium]|jgi:LacI family transcriptional regulator|nr:LacI family DNA-binding transcriptional regulator [Propionibacteriaceae bacterium]